MISKDIYNRVQWFKELKEAIDLEFQDKETAKLVFKTILFEENLR
jgi:hypothetical protein